MERIEERIATRRATRTRKKPSSPTNGGWQLPPGHFTPAKVPFPTTAYALQTGADTVENVIFPRPNNETDAHARQRWAHPQMDYEIPICIRGGAFPYHMEIDTSATSTALTGIAIGPNHDSPNSYLLTIPRTTMAGLSYPTIYDIVVKVTDQELNELRVYWSFQMEANELDRFFFVDSSYTGGTKDGRYTTPFDTLIIPGWTAGGSFSNSAGKTLVIRQGVGNYLKEAGWNISASGFPSGIIAFPGEEPVVDLESARPLCGFNRNDIFLRGISAINGRQPSGDGQGAFTNGFNNSYWRITIDGCTFDGVTAWSPSSTNSGMITFDGNGPTIFREFLAIINCTFRNSVGASLINEGMCIGIMTWKRAILDNNFAENIGTTGSGVSSVIYHKHATTHLEVRRLEARNNINVKRGAIYSNGTGQRNGYAMQNMEWRHNNIRLPGDSNVGTVPWGLWFPDNVYSTSEPPNTIRDGPHYAHRNTFEGTGVEIGISPYGWTGALDFQVLNNASQSPHSLSSAGPYLTDENNYTDAIYNPGGILTDAYLTANGLERGQIGHEIA